MAIESTIIDQWLFGLLSGDSIILAGVGTKVFANQIPQGTPKPCLVFVHQSGSGGDINALGARALVSPAYQVKAVGEVKDYPVLKLVADQADLLLQNARAVLSGYAIRCARQREISYPETMDGIEYEHLGGLYTIWISPTSG